MIDLTLVLVLIISKLSKLRGGGGGGGGGLIVLLLCTIHHLWGYDTENFIET